jgi:hypothetical protein
LSTLPARLVPGGERIEEFNQIIRNVALAYDVPLWDYASVMATLPNQGLSDDGVHPSLPPGPVTATTDFTPENLQYGYTLRNLMALQVLDQIWRQVIY